ncbi:hypothetical protein T492DRAFT_858022 [Pavlovales sp. CCMP2436]|nr:hypothetical protein T492DRAFT_858022 [Pavlovales sp. CCMP2436]
MALGQLLQDQGKLGEALPLLKRALKGCEEQLGASHPRTLGSAQGKLDEALPLRMRALKGSEE